MKLINYKTGEVIRRATKQEQRESQAALLLDKGRGVIMVDGVSCYVED